MKTLSSKRMLFWLSSAAAILLLALAVLVVLSTLGKGMAALLPAPTASVPALSAAQTTTPQTSATWTPFPYPTDTAREPYPLPPNSQPPATWTPLPTWYPPAKQTYEVGLELTRAYYHTFPPPTTTPGPSPTRRPTFTRLPFIPGIYQDGSAPVSSPYVMENYWQGVVNGEELRIFAGVKQWPGETSSQGVVLVITNSRDYMDSELKFYEAPIANPGALTIAAATGDRLTLQAESGAVLYFDVPTRQFVDSLSAKISASTVTPLPTMNSILLTPSPFPALPLSATPYP